MISCWPRYMLAATLTVSGLVPSLVAQVPPESLLARLRSPQWDVRFDALVRLRQLPRDSLPPGYADAVVQLLDQEAVSPDTSAFGEGRGEGYGEYLIEVVDAALSLRDLRTLPLRGMAVLGIQVSRIAADYVAQQGSTALPYLDEAWRSPYGSKHAIMDTWALMLGKYGDKLTGLERATIRRTILDSAGVDSLDVVLAAQRVPLPEALPLIDGIAAATTSTILRVSANRAVADLKPLRDALGPAEVVQKLSDVLAALCLGAQGGRLAACNSLSNSLNSASGLLTANQPPSARDTLIAFGARVDTSFQQGVWNDGEHRLLAGNARYVASRLPATLFLHGSGATANPPTLSLSTAAPTATTTKYKDSPSITFSGGNAWAQVGTWTAAPGLTSGLLTALGGAQVWLGLKNSDDIGTNFDLRVEASKNGALVAAGEALCISGITRNPDYAKAVTVTFAPFSATSFNGTSDALSFRVLTRIGTTGAGAFCGGHSNAVGLRLYFDAVSRAAQVAATF